MIREWDISLRVRVARGLAVVVGRAERSMMEWVMCMMVADVGGEVSERVGRVRWVEVLLEMVSVCAVFSSPL